MNSIVAVLLCAPVCTFLGTGLIRRYALRRDIIDVPGERSSHSVPVPRGGGLAFVAVILLGGAALLLLGAVSPRLFAAMAGGGGMVALVGWLDDKGGLRRRIRFAAHLFAAAWALWLLPAPQTVSLGFAEISWGWLGQAFFFLALAWMINSYNFMDGIDGLAGGEGIAVAFAGACIVGGESRFAALLVAAALPGFFVWNWPRAKIFMGDVGSGFLGYVLGVLWLATADTPAGFWGWPILLAAFIADATITLFWRIARGERWRDSHCSHAYQCAARRWGHIRVTLGVAGINVLWLVPWAVFCAHADRYAFVATVAAYSLPTVLCVLVKRRLP